MGSNNYGVVIEGADISAWLEKWDWSRRYYVLTVEDRTGIPDLIAVETDGVLTPGETVRERISRCGQENLEMIYWGNGIRGLCAYDGSALHYVLVAEQQ
jgi:hypothetical protein